jgi:hypothetical protein
VGPPQQCVELAQVRRRDALQDDHVTLANNDELGPRLQGQLAAHGFRDHDLAFG